MSVLASIHSSDNKNAITHKEKYQCYRCEIKKLQAEPHYRQYEPEILKSVVPPLNARDALFGGRTNACKLFAKVIKPGDMILYYDVCSLYPWVMKYCSYPVGHPTVILKDFRNVNDYYGPLNAKYYHLEICITLCSLLRLITS